MFGKAVRIFDVLGIPIRIDWSWPFVVLLVAWSLAVSWFPSVLTGAHPTWLYWALGIGGALGLFVSILLHELGHAVVARSAGVPIKGITLFIFGGVAEMREEPSTPGDELRIAIAGPAVSAVLGILLLALSGPARSAPLAHAVLAYLGTINLVLLAFNLLPGFPLDGGRVLRALLWRGRRSLAEATRTAGRVGSAVGLGLVALGVLLLLQGDPIGGVWLALIGLFLRSAAAGAYRQVLLRRQFVGLPIGRFARRDVSGASPVATMQELVDHFMIPSRLDVVPIVSNGALVGCVTSDQMHGVAHARGSMYTAEDVMAPCPDSVQSSPDRDSAEVLVEMMREGRNRTVLVDDTGRFAGIVLLEDLLWLSRLATQLDDPEVVRRGGRPLPTSPSGRDPSDKHEDEILRSAMI